MSPLFAFLFFAHSMPTHALLVDTKDEAFVCASFLAFNPFFRLPLCGIISASPPHPPSPSPRMISFFNEAEVASFPDNFFFLSQTHLALFSLQLPRRRKEKGKRQGGEEDAWTDDSTILFLSLSRWAFKRIFILEVFFFAFLARLVDVVSFSLQKLDGEKRVF